jgi:hypothetical protein
MNADQAINYAGICFAADHIAEIPEQQPTVVIPRANIKTLKLHYGFKAKHPILLAILGLVFIVIGLWQIVVVIQWLMYGGIIHEVSFILALMTCLGVWLIYDATQRGYLLIVETTHDQKRLEFNRSVRASDLKVFLNDAESLLNYSIQRQI